MVDGYFGDGEWRMERFVKITGRMPMSLYRDIGILPVNE